MTTFIARRIPIIRGVAEHTWVQVPGHGNFHCWDPFYMSWGWEIFRGSGIYDVANDYRKPFWSNPDTADLSLGLSVPYGFHGVCHQSTNCFMYSTGRIIPYSAWIGGYWATTAMFGFYGSLDRFGDPQGYGWDDVVYTPSYNQFKHSKRGRNVKHNIPEDESSRMFNKIHSGRSNIRERLKIRTRKSKVKLKKPIKSEFDHGDIIINDIITQLDDTIPEVNYLKFEETHRHHLLEAEQIFETETKPDQFYQKINKNSKNLQKATFDFFDDNKAKQKFKQHFTGNNEIVDILDPRITKAAGKYLKNSLPSNK